MTAILFNTVFRRLTFHLIFAKVEKNNYGNAEEVAIFKERVGDGESPT